MFRQDVIRTNKDFYKSGREQGDKGRKTLTFLSPHRHPRQQIFAWTNTAQRLFRIYTNICVLWRLSIFYMEIISHAAGRRATKGCAPTVHMVEAMSARWASGQRKCGEGAALIQWQITLEGRERGESKRMRSC